MDKVEKRNIIGVIIMALLAADIALITAIVDFNPANIDELKSIFLQLVFLFGVGIIVLCICGFSLYYLIKYFNRSATETDFKLFALKCSEKIQTKNSSVILPNLQYFLFYVLKENNEFLHLPLGKTVTSLIPTGTAFRDGCAFYQYQMILPTKIEQDRDALKQLIQQYIILELRNYGIVGLNSTYLDSRTGSWFTVYLDKLLVDSDSHYMIFELLYISSRASVKYVQKAIQRDDKQLTPEPEVFDDEL